MADDPPRRDYSGALGVLDRLLAWMTVPWKAITVVVLVVILGAGYLIYLERGSIADAILHRAGERAELDSPAFLRLADKLLRETRADYALLIELHLDDNLMIDRVGVDADGNRWIPSSGAQQALQPESSMPLVVRLLANEVVCEDVSRGLNDDFKALAGKGYARLCIVTVPPILGVTVGALVLAWSQALLPNAEIKARLTMQQTAMRLATW